MKKERKSLMTMLSVTDCITSGIMIRFMIEFGAGMFQVSGGFRKCNNFVII